MNGRRHVVAGLVLAAALPACRLTPLMNRVAVGEEPFLVVSGEGPDGARDLFAVPAAGGTAYRFTFTRHVESAPALDPGGTVAAFIRQDTGPGAERRLVVMNLLNAAERDIELPAIEGPVTLGWTRDGGQVVIRIGGSILSTPAPPAAMVLSPADGAPAADSALMTLLGEPVFARAHDCAGARGVCTVAGDSAVVLAPSGHAPFRWGTDSIAWLEGDGVAVRPLGPGRGRMLRIEGVRGLREASYSSGTPRGS